MSIKQLLRHGYLLARLPVIAALVFLGSVFAPRRSTDGRDGVKNMLIIRLDRLGDLVLTLPVIENIKLHDPRARLAILVRPYLAPLAETIASIDRVIEYRGFVRTARVVREAAFDLAIDMVDDYRLKPALMAALSGASRRVGFSGGYKERLFTDTIPGGDMCRPMTEINLDVVRALGIPVRVTEPRITLSRAGKSVPAVVALHPGGYYPSQRWPPGRFGVLARQIADSYDVDITVVGGKGDRGLVAAVMDALKGSRARAEFPDSAGLARILAGAALVICNNSGPLHLAAALGVPTVSTMGPTDPVRWWPRGDKAIVIRKELPCSPCGRGRCGDHACMDLIAVSEMFAAARTVLDKANAFTRR